MKNKEGIQSNQAPSQKPVSTVNKPQVIKKTRKKSMSDYVKKANSKKLSDESKLLQKLELKDIDIKIKAYLTIKEEIINDC